MRCEISQRWQSWLLHQLRVRLLALTTIAVNIWTAFLAHLEVFLIKGRQIILIEHLVKLVPQSPLLAIALLLCILQQCSTVHSE